MRQGLRFLRAELPRILATPPDVLSPRMVRVIEGLAEDWRLLDARIEHLSSEIKAVAQQDSGCERLMSVPGIGPIISSAIVAAIGVGDGFSKGRDFAAWLGLVPKQISTGDRTILGKISKRGNRFLRVLFVQAGWVVLIKPQSWERHGLKPWIEAAKKRLHRNCSCDRACQQTGQDCLERSGSWPKLRGEAGHGVSRLQFELIYVVGEERDVVGVRTNYRHETVYLYRLNASAGDAQRLLLVYLARINELALKSEAIGLKPSPTSGRVSMEMLKGGTLSKMKLTKVCATSPSLL